MPLDQRKLKKARPEEKEDFGDFGDYLQLLSQLQLPGVLTAWPRYRQGGSPRYWDTPGEKNFTTLTGFTQLGSVEQTIATPGSRHSWVWVKLPVAYSGRFLIFASVLETTPTSMPSYCMARCDGLKDWFVIDWWSEGEFPVTRIRFAWLTFGPGAVPSE